MASTDISIPRPEPQPLSSEERKTLVLPSEPWPDSRAYQVAKTDYETAVNFLNKHHYQRWEQSDRLYLASRGQKTWKGTSVPRASIPVFHAMSQIESMQANVIGALFSDDFDFNCDPRPGTTLAQSQAVLNLLRNQLEDLDPERGYVTLRELLRRAFKSGNMYGNGILYFGWLKKEMEFLRYGRENLPVRAGITDPETGEQYQVPTGDSFQRTYSEKQTKTISSPLIRNVDIRDFFIDPNCSSHMVQDGAFAGIRCLVAIRDIECYRKDGRYKLPTQKQLVDLVKAKRATRADNTKAATETYQRSSWQPWMDTSEDPLSWRIEQIFYWTPERAVQLVTGWDSPIYNQPNDCGVLPFLSVGHVDVPGRFYNLSMCDLVEGDQNLIASILEARMDELSLSVHAPTIRNKNQVLTGTQRRIFPGAEIEVEGDAKTAYYRMEMGNITQQAFIEVDQADRRSQKTTGITDLSAMGVPTSGGNSASRTATGVNAQSAATGRRIEYQVMNIEEQVIVPLLNTVLALDQKYLDPMQMLQLAGPGGEQLEIDPIDVLNASVRFKFQASRRLRARNAMLAGGGLAVILETVFSPQIIPALAQFGKKPNVEGITNLVADTYGLPHEQLYLDMSPEEQQAHFQQQMAPDMIRMQMQRERIQGQMVNAEERDETKLLQALISALAKHPEVMASLAKEFGMDEPMAMLKEKNKKPPVKPAAKK